MMACDHCKKPFGEACETECLTIANMQLRANRNRYRGTHTPGNWPMLSHAAGCMPHEVEAARRQAKKFGVPTDFTPRGEAVFTSAAHRRKYLRLRGWVDKAGYN